MASQKPGQLWTSASGRKTLLRSQLPVPVRKVRLGERPAGEYNSHNNMPLYG